MTRPVKKSTPRPQPARAKPSASSETKSNGKPRPQAQTPKLSPPEDLNSPQRLQQRIDEAAEDWQRLTGEPMPNSVEEWKVAAVRYGMPPDVVHSGEFTGNDVWTFVVGKKLAQLDDLRHTTDLARAKSTKASQSVGIAPKQPTGLMSVPELVQAFGIPQQNVAALKKRLQRERSRLYADAVRELREPRSHKPKFLYDAGHEEVRKLIANYLN
jgi:hypothetical protein